MAYSQVGLTGRSFSVKSELARHKPQKSGVLNHSEHVKLLKRKNNKSFYESKRLQELDPDDDIEDDPESGNAEIADHRKFMEWIANTLKQ